MSKYHPKQTNSILDFLKPRIFSSVEAPTQVDEKQITFEASFVARFFSTQIGGRVQGWPSGGGSRTDCSWGGFRQCLRGGTDGG